VQQKKNDWRNSIWLSNTTTHWSHMDIDNELHQRMLHCTCSGKELKHTNQPTNVPTCSLLLSCPPTLDRYRILRSLESMDGRTGYSRTALSEERFQTHSRWWPDRGIWLVHCKQWQSLLLWWSKSGSGCMLEGHWWCLGTLSWVPDSVTTPAQREAQEETNHWL